MGEVYKGHDPVLNGYVAIKVIAQSIDTNPELIERFRREAKAAARLNRPNISDGTRDRGDMPIAGSRSGWVSAVPY